MKKPYRDSLGRFARRPGVKGKRKKRHVQTRYTPKDFIFYRDIPESFAPPLFVDRPKRIRRGEEIKETERERPSTPTHRETFAPYEPPKIRKWEDIEEIIDTYIDDLDLDEDIIGGS